MQHIYGKRRNSRDSIVLLLLASARGAQDHDFGLPLHRSIERGLSADLARANNQLILCFGPWYYTRESN